MGLNIGAVKQKPDIQLSLLITIVPDHFKGACTSYIYVKNESIRVRPLKPMPSSRWGIGRFYLSGSKCTVSARILHGFKPCRGCFSLQNPTKGAEIAG